MTREECLLMVKKDGWALQYVPEKLIDREICLIAIKKNGWALQYVPKELIDREMCLEAVKNDGWALYYVPEELKDKEICYEAVKNTGDALRFVPEGMLSDSKIIICKNRSLYINKINREWRFTIGCQNNISKEEFIERIYEEDGGLELNPHRQEYLDILENY